MKLFCAAAVMAFLITSCSKTKYCTLKITFSCTPTVFFDTLSNVLLSNSYSDLGASGGSSNPFSLFWPARIYLRKVARNADNTFHVEKVQKGYYEYLYIEGFTGGALYDGVRHKLDFSNVKGDTAEIEICMNPNMRIIYH